MQAPTAHDFTDRGQDDDTAEHERRVARRRVKGAKRREQGGGRGRRVHRLQAPFEKRAERDRQGRRRDAGDTHAARGEHRRRMGDAEERPGTPTTRPTLCATSIEYGREL